MSSQRHKADEDPTDVYLDAAREVILAVGWKRTTLTDVARRAGVSRMTLYRRWPDMSTLLADLMTREWAGVAEAVAAVATAATATAVTAAEGSRVPGAEAIGDAVAATVTAMRGNPLLRRILDVDPELLLPYLLDRRGRSQDAVLALLEASVTTAQGAGTVRAGDPVLLARSVLLAAYGFTLSATTMAAPPQPTRPGVGLDDLDRELAALVTRYLAP